MIKCAHCKGSHAAVADVKACSTQTERKFSVHFHNGQPMSIDLTKLDERRPKIEDVDEVMKALSRDLGGTWYAVKLSGVWLINHNKRLRAGDPEQGHKLRRNFDLAVRDATGLAIVRSIPLAVK